MGFHEVHVHKMCLNEMISCSRSINRTSQNCDTISAPPPPPPPPPHCAGRSKRTLECEQWCREASRSAAGCVGVVLLALGYAAVGGALFMAIETRAANMIRDENVKTVEKLKCCIFATCEVASVQSITLSRHHLMIYQPWSPPCNSFSSEKVLIKNAEEPWLSVHQREKVPR